jgi:predicted transcriptional regulator
MAQPRRAYFDIVANIIGILSEGPCKKTNLASRASLDTRAIQKYINLILKTNLASLDQAKILKITSKGNEFLLEYRKLKLYLEG